MSIEQYRIGQKVSVVKNTDGSGKEYFSKIQNIKDNVIYITVPYRGETPLVLMHNEMATLKYIAQNAAFVFTSTFLGTHQETEVLRLYKFNEPSVDDIKRIQLRNFVRIPITLDVEFLSPDSKENQKGIAVDISGGGMKLATKDKLKEDAVIDIYFILTTKKQELQMKLKAQVVRCTLAGEESGVYHSGLQFVDINQGTEDKICSFVFEKQMEQLRKR
ncbi:MAG: hypothetical protein FH758_04700 [Firmicutes bacterium]|nr:hypothetical protein [Bacillota bacterium]